MAAAAGVAASRQQARSLEDPNTRLGKKSPSFSSGLRVRGRSKRSLTPKQGPGLCVEDFDRPRSVRKRRMSFRVDPAKLQPASESDLNRAVDQIQLNIRGTRLTSRFMIDPRYSMFSQNWDLITMFALLFTAIVTPFEVPRAEPCLTAPPS